MRPRAVLQITRVVTRVTALFAASAFVLCGGPPVLAQTTAPNPSAPHAMTDAEQNKALADQVAELRAQVARLQAALEQPTPPKKSTPAAGMKMAPAPPKPIGMMDDKGDMGMAPKGAMPAGKPAMPPGRSMGMGMGMKDDDDGEMGAMSSGAAGNMPSSPAPAMGMCCMGDMATMPGAVSGGAAPAQGGMAGMNGPSSATPGQPGASHLYHVGSTGFFLNHPQHITLTTGQKSALNRVKEKAMLDRASEQRYIDQAEQELYTLTGADAFDNAKVQAKIGEIEKLRAGQRMNFITAVGEASSLLTPAQHQALMGTMPVTKK